MKWVLSILLINLLLIQTYQNLKDDGTNELLMKDKKIEKLVKDLEKFKKFFRILEDTSESSESEDESTDISTEPFDTSESSESQEPSESSESEEPSESSESEEPSESSESEEPSESSESQESSESEEPSESSESEEPSESSESEEPSESSESQEPSESSESEEPSESSESEEPSESSESEEPSESSESEEPSESSESEEPSESSESEEPSESSESEEPSESSESEEPSESSESEESSESSESEESSESSESEEPIISDQPSETSHINYTSIPTETPSETTYPSNYSDPLQRYPAPIGNRLSYYHLLRFSNFRFFADLFIIRFYIYFEFHLVRPVHYISFSIRIIYKSTWFRHLQNYEANETAICERYKDIDGQKVIQYDCHAATQKGKGDVLTVSSNNVFYLDGVKLEYGEMNFSPGASKASFNIQNEVSDIDGVVTLNEGRILDNNTDTFWIKGKMKDLNVDKIPFTFYDVYTKERMGYDVTCDVINREENNFQLKCTPPDDMNLTGYLYQSNGTVGTKDINLNLTKYYDYANVTHLVNKHTNQADNNVNFRKAGSGLSGGAIAGIVIGLSIILCCITIIIVFLKRPKKKEENDSSIVGLRTIDNY